MKTDKHNCEYLYLCPAYFKCRIAGIYTRKNTINCNCRDLIKQLELANGKKRL